MYSRAVLLVLVLAASTSAAPGRLGSIVPGSRESVKQFNSDARFLPWEPHEVYAPHVTRAELKRYDEATRKPDFDDAMKSTLVAEFATNRANEALRALHHLERSPMRFVRPGRYRKMRQLRVQDVDHFQNMAAQHLSSAQPHVDGAAFGSPSLRSLSEADAAYHSLRYDAHGFALRHHEEKQSLMDGLAHSSRF